MLPAFFDLSPRQPLRSPPPHARNTCGKPWYRNQSIDLQSESIESFLYDGNFNVKWVNDKKHSKTIQLIQSQ